MATQTLILCGCGNRLPLSACSHPSMLCCSSYEPRHHGLRVQWRGNSSRRRCSTVRLQNPKMRFCIGKQTIFWLHNVEMKGGWVWPVVALSRTGNAIEVWKWVKKLNEKMEGLQRRSWEVVDNHKKRILLSTAHIDRKKPYQNIVEEWLFLLDDIIGKLSFNGAEEDEAFPLALGSFSSSTDHTNIGQVQWFANDLPQVEQSSKTRSTSYGVSTQFETQKNSGHETKLRSMVGNANFFVQKASPFVRYLGGSFVLFYGLCLVWGLCAFFSGRMQPDEKETIEKDLRLSRIRQMKSELNGDVEAAYVATEKLLATDSLGKANGKPIMADDEAFRKRILQIRHLASQARLAEQQTIDVRHADSSLTDVVGATSLEETNVLTDDIPPHLSSDRLASLAKELDDVRTLSMDATNDPINPGESSRSGIEESTASSRSNGDNLNQGSISYIPELKSSSSGLHYEDDHKHNLREISADTNGRAGSPINGAHPRVKPRVIISVEEAMARRAAKRGKIANEDSLQKKTSRPSHLKGRYAKGLKSEPLDAEEILSQEKVSVRESDFKDLVENARNSAVLDHGLANGQLKGEEIGESSLPVKKEHVLLFSGSSTISNDQNQQQKTQISEEEASKDQDAGKYPGAPMKLLDKEGSFDWMKDDVLREIVFTVRANELAGKDPFYGLGPEEESLFYKGLEKRFQGEEEKVKNWIRERVDQLDHGKSNPVKRHEVEGEMKVHEVKGEVQNEEPRTELVEKLRKPPPFGNNSSSKSAALSSKVTREDPFKTETNPAKSSAPIITRSGGAVMCHDPAKGSGPTVSRSGVGANVSKASSKNEWQHTKQWGKELQAKYDTESDPETRALMKRVGRDLDRWITEEEIEEAYNLLSKGPAGEKEYVRKNYERTRAKIKQQKELFGAEAMVNKYREYKPKKEDELWWFDLPYVLCIGLQTTEKNEVRGGLYSLDMSVDFEDGGKQEMKFHTIAFQDRQEAIKFSYLLKSQPGKIAFSRVEILPYSPKDLYNEAKAEGFRVTVIGKGKLQLLPGKLLEEIEQRIIEIGTASFWNERFNERAIDIQAVLKEGLGHRRSSH